MGSQSDFCIGDVVVIKGPAAIRVGKYWRAVLSGDVWLPKQFRTPEAALEYGAKHEKSKKN